MGDSWFTDTVYDIPDAYLIYSLFGWMAFIDLFNLLAKLGVKVCVNTTRKVEAVRRGIQHFLFCDVHKWKPEDLAPPPESCEWPADNERTAEDTRRVILIRHGESVWNKVFNRGI